MSVRLDVDVMRLKESITSAIELGAARAVKMYEPLADRVKASEVKVWLKVIGVDEAIFNRLVKTGAIKCTRRGSGTTSPREYSKQEILQVLVTKQLGGIITDFVLGVGDREKEEQEQEKENEEAMA